jgi:hypothetical protein
VWAIPATDTLAGAAFGLTSTIVIPESLNHPFRLRKYLRAGRTEHRFFDVPAHAGGLNIRVTVQDAEQHATLYLFEPGGRPFRGGSSVEIGGEYREREVVVRGDDVIPGVYEIVITATPTAGVTFDLTTALPPVALAMDDDGASVSTRTGKAVNATVVAEVIGAARVIEVRAQGTEARRIPVRVPSWASEMVLDVELAESVWTRFTDFALSTWDSAGRLVAQQPLNYAVSRQHVTVDSIRNAPLVVELFPAFALPGDSTTWAASVRVSFVARHAFQETAQTLRPGPDQPAAIPLPVPALDLPDGFFPLLETTAQTEDGIASRRGRLPVAGNPGTR